MNIYWKIESILWWRSYIPSYLLESKSSFVPDKEILLHQVTESIKKKKMSSDPCDTHYFFTYKHIAIWKTESVTIYPCKHLSASQQVH